MKTFLYIGGFELPDKNASAHRVLSLGKTLRDIGYKVVFVGISKSGTEIDILKTYSNLQGFDTYYVPYPKTFLEWITYVTSIKSYIRVVNTIDNLAGVIMADFPAISMLKFLIYCKNKRLLAIAECTEWFITKFKLGLFYFVKTFDTWLRMCVLQKKCHLVIAISKSLFEYYKNHTNTIYIPVLVDKKEEKWKNLQGKSFNTDVLQLVYAGSPGDKDNILLFMQSLGYVNRKYHVDIIGITYDEFVTHYKTQISDNVLNHVNFRGRLSHLESLNYVSKSHYSCFFRPVNRVSKNGFPTKFAEAISCGTPVITNNTSNLIDFAIDNKNCVILSSANVFEISKCLENLPYHMETMQDLFDFRLYISPLKEILTTLNIAILQNEKK